MRTYQTGGSTLLVYESKFAGTNRATAATWFVGKDVDGIVRDLKAKGVSFEHYDMPDTRLEGDVHVVGRPAGRVAQGSRRQHPGASPAADGGRRAAVDSIVPRSTCG